MKKLEEYVISIPDFPEPGIIFRDVTSILQDADGLHLAIDQLIDMVKDIDFEAGTVYVDGIALDEPYVSSRMTHLGIDFPLVVDEGCLFVMGDNRIISEDSRSPKIGQIDRREVLGKAIFLFVPGTDKGKAERDFSRLGVLNDGPR